MGKRYYCDYCDKSFPDNLDQRRKHLKGVVHQRNKNQFYQSLQASMWHTANANSRLTGPELLQQWLARHPEIIERAATKSQAVPSEIKDSTALEAKKQDMMNKGYVSITGMKYPPEIAQGLLNVVDLPPSLHCSS